MWKVCTATIRFSQHPRCTAFHMHKQVFINMDYGLTQHSVLDNNMHNMHSFNIRQTSPSAKSATLFTCMLKLLPTVVMTHNALYMYNIHYL